MVEDISVLQRSGNIDDKKVRTYFNETKLSPEKTISNHAIDQLVVKSSLSKVEILRLFKVWLTAWNQHNIDGVMELFHENIVFENWTGNTIIGKNVLRKSWAPWFVNHGNFKFIEEDVFIDEEEQKMLFRWRLEWPSQEKFFKGKQEIRRGADVLLFIDGKIISKYTYSKTTIHIESLPVSMYATPSDFYNQK